jgi:hypothetical protein
MSLSHRASRLYTHGLMWSIGKTDGLISQDQLPMLLPHDSPAKRMSAAAELVQRGQWQWVDEPAGWLYPDWTDRQSTLAQIQHNRARRKQTGERPPGSTGTATATAKGSLALRGSNHSETLTVEQQRAIVIRGTP